LLEVRAARASRGASAAKRDPTFPPETDCGPKCLLKLSKSLHSIVYHVLYGIVNRYYKCLIASLRLSLLTVGRFDVKIALRRHVAR